LDKIINLNLEIMKRIFYLFKTLFLVLFVTSVVSSCDPPRDDKYIGIQLWSVRGDMNADPEGTLRELGEMGYSFVEAAGYSNGMLYGMEPETFTSLVEASGMEFVSSHIGLELPQEDGWDEAMQWWETAIDAHARAGAGYVVQPFMPSSAFESLDILRDWAGYFNAIGELARARGLRFGFHNHAIEFTQVEGQVAYDFLLENTDPDLVFFQIDLYWIEEGGKDAIDYFNRYPGRFLMYHVKDREEVGASGEMDFRPAFENADVAGLRYVIVEVEQYNYEPLESVRISLDYLLDADYVRDDYR
jgi:sugar phosphate isomerase/epimerase